MKRATLITLVVIGLLVLAFGPMLTVIEFTAAEHHSCVKINGLREQFLTLVDSGVARSKKAADAPTATPVQKTNYASALHGAHVIHDGLPFDPC